MIAGHLSTQDVEDEGGEAAEDAKDRIRSDALEVSIGGFAPSFNEVNDQTRSDLTKAELIAFPVLAILLLLVFRGVVAAAIPLLIGVVSILGTFLVLRVMATFVDTSLFALNIATALSLGLAVDYALLLVSRYREELESDGPTREAHRRTVVTAGRTGVLGLHGRGCVGGAGAPAPALPLLDGHRRRRRRAALRRDRRPGGAVAPVAAGRAHKRTRGAPRPRRLRPVHGLVPARAGSHAPAGGGGARHVGCVDRRVPARALDGADRPERRGRAAVAAVL